MSDSDGSHPSDTMGERVPENSRKFWLLWNANPWLVAAGISGVVFLALAIIGQLHPTGTPALFSQADPIETLFQGLLTSIITGVTLVLALSQPVLSQELGPVGDQRERMEGAMAYLGVSFTTLLEMLANITTDVTGGSIPYVGTVFDALSKATSATSRSRWRTWPKRWRWTGPATGQAASTSPSNLTAECLLDCSQRAGLRAAAFEPPNHAWRDSEITFRHDDGTLSSLADLLGNGPEHDILEKSFKRRPDNTTLNR